jgi:hypothetical protein
MNEQRRQILEMLAEGKITADEAERLIGALEREQPEPRPQPGAVPSPAAKARPKYLRVLVTDNPGGDEPGRVNVRIPLQLLRAGVKLTSLVPPRALTRINTELDKAGVPIDLTQLKPEDLEAIIEQIDDVTIDVDDPGGKVQVFCE